MSVENDITEVINHIADLSKDDTLMFASPVTIKKTPHSWPIRITGVKVVAYNLYLEHYNEWNLFNGDQMIINSILQRLRSLKDKS